MVNHESWVRWEVRVGVGEVRVGIDDVKRSRELKQRSKSRPGLLQLRWFHLWRRAIG